MDWHPLLTTKYSEFRAALVARAKQDGLPDTDAEDFASHVVTCYIVRWRKNPTVKFINFLNQLEEDLGRNMKLSRKLYELMKYRRRLKRQQVRNLETEPASLRDFTKDIEHQEVLQRLLGCLSQRDRNLICSLMQGYKTNEVAEQIGRSRRTVSNLLNAFRERASRQFGLR